MYKKIIWLFVIFSQLGCYKPPTQITNKIPSAKDVPYLYYITKNNTICTLNALGYNNKYIKNIELSFGGSTKGTKAAKIARNGNYIAFINGRDLYLKNLKTNQVKIIDKYYKQTNEYYPSSLYITLIVNNKFLIYFRESSIVPIELKHNPKAKQGFYIYNIKEKTISYLNGIGGIMQEIPNTNKFLCYRIKKNQNYNTPNLQNKLSYYDIVQQKFQKLNNYPLSISDLTISGNNILAFVYLKNSSKVNTWIGFIDLIKNKEYNITSKYKNQNCQSIWISDNGRFIIYKKEKEIPGYSSSDNYIYIHDVLKNSYEVLMPADYSVYGILNRWLIYSLDKKIYSLDLYTNKTKVIANDCHALRD